MAEKLIELVPAEILNMNGKIIQFKGINENWPHPVFLKYHNKQFEFVQKKLEAAAEPREYDRHESGNTIINDEDYSLLSKISDNIWEEEKNTRTFLQLE